MSNTKNPYNIPSAEDILAQAIKRERRDAGSVLASLASGKMYDPTEWNEIVTMTPTELGAVKRLVEPSGWSVNAHDFKDRPGHFHGWLTISATKR